MSSYPPREPMRNVDKAWLGMDTPTNLMIINGVMLFDAPIDYARFCNVLEDRLVRPYRRFRQRIVNRLGSGGVAWQVDPHFDLRSHLRHLALPAPGDVPTLQALVSDLISEGLEPHRPLWRFYLIDNVDGGCAVFGRLHHCIADGIALVQVLLSLTDNAPDAPVRSPAKSRSAKAPGPQADEFTAAAQEPSPAQRLPTPPSYSLSVATPFSLLRTAVESTGRFVKSAATMTLHQGVQTVVNPRHLVEAAYTAGLISVTGAAILGKLLVLPPDNDSVFKGNLSAHKKVVWSEPVDLERVKVICRAANATLNDVLVTAVAGALRRYMEAHGGAVDLRAMVPVNLRDPSKPLEDLGNEFALVYLTLPLQEPSAARRLHAIKRQMDMLKQSPEPLLIYEILNLIGMVPGELAEWATTWFSTKASAVLTNVPGPRTQLYFCSVPMRRIMFWVPQSGRIGLGISIISYCGAVSLGIMVDEWLIAEPGAILAAFAEELESLGIVAASGATPASDAASGAGASRPATNGVFAHAAPAAPAAPAAGAAGLVDKADSAPAA